MLTIFPKSFLLIPIISKDLELFCGYTQAQLAELSQVSLRSIQMYEQRKKNINKASAKTLYLLSKALSCKMEDLIEK
jgi:transcriptional regulator with XRE-family HTH domain